MSHIPRSLVQFSAALGAALLIMGCDDASKGGAPSATARAEQAASAIAAPSTATSAAAAPVPVPSASTDASTSSAEPSSSGTPAAEASAARAGSVSSGRSPESAPSSEAVAASSASAAPASSAVAVAEPSATAAPPPPPAVDGEKKTGAQYAAYLSGPKKVKAGSSVALSAVFTASGGYHCNEKYPTSFKPDAAPAGVTFASEKFSSAAFGAKRSSVPVSLTASTPGSKRVSGTLKFGVCDESECIPVKAPVAFAFDVE